MRTGTAIAAPSASPFLSRLAAIGILAIVMALVWFGAVAPVLGAFADQAAERERQVDLKHRYVRAAADIESLRRERDRLAKAKTEREDLLTAPSAAAAAAAMQGDVKRAVEAAGGELRRVTVAPPESGEAAERILLRVLATAELEGLGAMLTALEIEDPRYRVGDLRVEPDRSRRGKQQDRLTIRFELYGFRPLAGGAAPNPRRGGPNAAPALRRLADG